MERIGWWKNEAHGDLCLLQEVAEIQGGVCILVHLSCQVQAAPGVVATKNVVTDKDAPSSDAWQVVKSMLCFCYIIQRGVTLEG